MNNKFTITTTKDVYECRFLTIATGYYGQHNTLEVEGADLPKVFHYFKEAHPYFDRMLLLLVVRIRLSMLLWSWKKLVLT